MTVVDHRNSEPRDDRIEFHSHFPVSQQELWSAVVDDERLSDWFGGSCTIEAVVGGRVHFDLPGDGVLADGVVRAFDPPREAMAVAHLEHTFVDRSRPELTAICRWSVVRTDSGCDLYFTMDGAGEADSTRLSQVWGRVTDGDQAGPSQEEALVAFASAETVLLVDWIGPETPTTIASIAPVVFGKIGPRADDWARVEPDGSSFKATRGPRPEHVDLLHLDWTLGFEEFVGVAQELRAKTFWYHSARTRPPAPADHRGVWVPPRQSTRQRQLVEARAMTYIDNHNIVDIARLQQSSRPG